MNLVDLLDEGGLKQDEWSLTAPTFGKEGQLTVVGWSRRDKSGKGHKLYILRCVKCSQDSELFGEGYFSITKGNLVNGVITVQNLTMTGLNLMLRISEEVRNE